MLRDDAGPAHETGAGELTPYYARRLEVARPASGVSGRRQAVSADPEAQAERLFRDFKLGILTLVVVSVLLLAYFWEGEPTDIEPRPQPEESVLRFNVLGRRRNEVAHLPAATECAPRRNVLPAAPKGVPSFARRTSGGAGSEGAVSAARAPSVSRAEAPGRRATVYTVQGGDTLSAIALRFYGDASAWRTILDANSRRLRRPTDLRAGMKIVVPDRNAAAPSQPTQVPAQRAHGGAA